MYSQQELDDAVAAGVMTPAAADAFRAYVERQRSSVIADEEQFRLLTGFNDIFVSIAAAILLFAVAWIGQWLGQNSGFAIEGEGPSPLAPLGVASDPVPVRRPAVSLPASFPRSVTLPQLRLASIRMVSFRRDLHPQDGAHAGRTNDKRPTCAGLPFSREARATSCPLCSS